MFFQFPSVLPIKFFKEDIGVTHFLYKCVFFCCMALFVSDAFSGTVTRSCSSRLEVKYDYYGFPPLGGAANYKPRVADKWLATTGWGYTRSSSSSGWIPSPSAARERACKSSAGARADAWTVSKLDKAIDKVCRKYDYSGTLELLDIRARAESDGYSHSVYLNLETYRNFDYSDGITFYNCETGELFDGHAPKGTIVGPIQAVSGCPSGKPC